MILGPRHLAILLALGRYWYLCAQDVQRLLGLKSRPYTRRLLGELCGGEGHARKPYLRRFPLPMTRPGGVEHFYTLSAGGVQALAREGVEVSGSVRPSSKVARLSYGTTLHDLTLSRFLVALSMQPGLEVSELRTQYELQQDPILLEATRGTGPDGGAPTVVPDAWVRVERHIGDTREVAPLLIEIDQGTRFRKSISRQVEARLSFLQGPYEKIFQTGAVTVVFLTTAGSGRLDALRRWTEDVLAEKKREDLAEFFLFGEASFATMYEEAHKLLTEKVWYRADRDDSVALFG